MDDSPVSADATMIEQEDSATPAPSLPRRLFDTVFSPGRMTAAVAENPKWLGALLVSAALIALGTALIPAETLMEVQRRAALERGVEVPRVSEDTLTILRFVVPVFAMISSMLLSFLLAGVYAVIFAFILGDEGTYRQYLAMVAHSAFVPALGALLVTPLRISTGDPQFTLNLASFLIFLPPGYWLNVFRVMDLTQIWSMLITARGAQAIDRRRSFGSAATILIGILFAIALVFGRFLPT